MTLTWCIWRGWNPRESATLKRNSCVLSKPNIPLLQGLLCCHVYTQANKCLTFFSDEGTVCASGAYYFKKHKWRESPNPSGTDGLNILILEPHGERQGLGNRKGRLIRDTGHDVSLLRCFQGPQPQAKRGPKRAKRLSWCLAKVDNKLEKYLWSGQGVDFSRFGFCVKRTSIHQAVIFHLELSVLYELIIALALWGRHYYFHSAFPLV